MPGVALEALFLDLMVKLLGKLTLDDEVRPQDAHGSDTDAGLRGSIGSTKACEHDGACAAHGPEKGLRLILSVHSTLMDDVFGCWKASIDRYDSSTESGVNRIGVTNRVNGAALTWLAAASKGDAASQKRDGIARSPKRLAMDSAGRGRTGRGNHGRLSDDLPSFSDLVGHLVDYSGSKNRRDEGSKETKSWSTKQERCCRGGIERIGGRSRWEAWKSKDRQRTIALALDL